MGYLKQSIYGLSWIGLFKVITRTASFIRIAILARLLNPSQFGIFGVASLMLVLLETFTQTGINVYLIQERQSLEDYVDTSWAISIIRGFIITLILLLSAPLVAYFFNSQESVGIIRLIALVALIRGFINPSRVKYLKDLNFKSEIYFSGVIFIFDAVVSTIAAYALRSPVALVWGLITGAVLEMILSLIIIKPRPRIALNISKAKEIVSRGKWVTSGTIFDFLFSQGDDAIVGRLLDTSSLGIYQVSYKISSLPITEITRSINQVTFPIYSKISGDKERLRKAFVKSLSVVILLSGTLTIILFLIPKTLVSVVLGDKWLMTVPIIKALSLFGFIRAVTISFNPLFNSLKKQNIVSHYTFISTLVMSILIIPMVLKWQVIGATYAVVIGSISALPIILFYYIKLFYEES